MKILRKSQTSKEKKTVFEKQKKEQFNGISSCRKNHLIDHVFKKEIIVNWSKKSC